LTQTNGMRKSSSPKTHLHPHFTEEGTSLDSSSEPQTFLVGEQEEKSFVLNFGMILTAHTYETTFIVGNLSGDPEIRIERHSEAAPDLKITKLPPSEENTNDNTTTFNATLTSHQNGIFEEKFHLIASRGQKLHVVVRAQVLRITQGKPLLKEGVRCIGIPSGLESGNESEWDGFHHEQNSEN